MSDNNVSLFDYKREVFYRSIANNHIWFDVEKVCGYSELTSIHHLSTTQDLWHHVANQFENKNIILYYFDNSPNKTRIEFPQSNDMLLHRFLREHNKIFIPIYPYPANVVYKLYLDDGCHDPSHNHCEQSDAMKMDLSVDLK